MDCGELRGLIEESAKGGDALAMMVHALDLLNHRVALVLSAEDDDAGEEALTSPATVVNVDIRISALANARTFYQQRKAAAVKTAKTVAAAEVAIRAAERKAAATVSPSYASIGAPSNVNRTTRPRSSALAIRVSAMRALRKSAERQRGQR